MATISVDFDSKGDIELIMEEKKPGDLGGAIKSAQTAEQEDLPKCDVGPITIPVREFRLRVSSLRLMAASRYFQVMLEGRQFPEGRELEEEGEIPIQLLDPEDDPTAMMIILVILYESNIRTKVDLPTLEKVTILVDKYQFETLVTPFAISWADELEVAQGLPTTFDENLLRWLFIAWKLGLEGHFKEFSKIAQQQACKSIDPMDEKVPLPPRVLEGINNKRTNAIQKIEQSLRDFKHNVLDPDPYKKQPGNVGDTCLMLGFAIMSSQELELDEFAKPDYAGVSVLSLKDLVDELLEVGEFRVLMNSSDSLASNIVPGEAWDLNHSLKQAFNDLKMDEWGLDYDNLKSPPVVDQVRLDLEHQKIVLDDIASKFEAPKDSELITNSSAQST